MITLDQLKFESSAIEKISEQEDDKVAITFVGGRQYVYSVPDIQQFAADLTEVVSNQKSVGKFVNTSIKNKDLLPVT